MSSLLHDPEAPAFRDILHRLEKLAPFRSSMLHTDSLAHPPGACVLDAPFAYSCRAKTAEDDFPTVIDTFAPRLSTLESSPSSSSSSSEYDPIPSQSRSPLEAFVATRSRVVRLHDLPAPAEAFLSAIFSPHNAAQFGPIPIPITLWALRDDVGPKPSSVWAVFKCHEEARAALLLSGSAMSVATALESDLEPFHKLRRFDFKSPAPKSAPHSPSPRVAALHHPMLHVSTSLSDLHSTALATGDYTLSSNPPNPKTSFRLGDWMCPSSNCAAHNFGRNLVCIGCGVPRSNNNGSSSTLYQTPPPPTRPTPSPRFYSALNHSYPSTTTASSASSPLYPTSPQSASCSHFVSQVPSGAIKPVPPIHPILTPSGRAFARGGRVRNISTDPTNPIIMYWPDNEPLPDPGQIRPSGLAGVAHPPILNTGNRGPISHQPGDWICQKCNYLNWRRRKVCQTCLPYAEGNGDSISAAVQAERIALLTSVLTQAQSQSPIPRHVPSPRPFGDRSQSMTPPQHARSCAEVPARTRGPVHRSQSHFELGAQYAHAHPIYETSGARLGSPNEHGAGVGPLPVHAPAPLLPSFLQNIVTSPTLSPASTESADLSLEDYEENVAPLNRPTTRGCSRTPNSSAVAAAAAALPLNIWQLDGEESKSLSAFALPNLLVTSRKNSLEYLRS